MGKSLVNDELWKLIQPLLPPPKPRRQRYPGRKPLSDRRVLTGVVFVLKSGIPWEMLPQEMGCGSGMTCWRRLRDWQESGVWQRLHKLLLSNCEQPAGLIGPELWWIVGPSERLGGNGTRSHGPA